MAADNSIKHWRQILLQHWGIEANLTRLPGERDLNFIADGNRPCVLKIMHARCPQSLVEMQCQAIAHIKQRCPQVPVPGVIPTSVGGDFCSVTDQTGEKRIAWLIAAVPGKTYASFNARPSSLIRQIGASIGAMDEALESFEHASLERDFKWDLTQSEWIVSQLDALATPARVAIIEKIVRDFRAIKPVLALLDRVPIHNDVNDHNILVHSTPETGPELSGIIDFGDCCKSPRVCEIAIAGAYIVLGSDKPLNALSELLAGYHSASPLSAQEIDLIWPLLKMRLAVSVVNSSLMARESPADPYVTVSQKAAWAFLEMQLPDEALIAPRLKVACGLPPCEAEPRIEAWLNNQRGNFAEVILVDLNKAPMHSLSVENSTCPQNPFRLTQTEAKEMGAEHFSANDVFLGYYKEPRLIYTEAAFQRGPWRASDRRTVHLGADIFGAAETQVASPLEASVVAIERCEDYLNYGGLVVLQHETSQGDAFRTLYGHLDPGSIERLEVGQKLSRGQHFAKLGPTTHNGGWRPHLHFQLSVLISGIGANWPGAADPDELSFWSAIFPNPAALLNIPDEKLACQTKAESDILSEREARFGKNLSISYKKPVMFLRGWKHHLFDQWGRAFLDAYNNVPHVGHAHPRIQSVAAEQLQRMNSNTRYIHPAQNDFARTLLAKMPGEFEVCYFVNSGSEANELALRLARAHSGGHDMITPDHGYHGNTTGAIGMSAYKFNAPGGAGQPDWVQLVEVADDYRGRFRRDDPDRAEKYARQVIPAIDAINARDAKLAGFIAETFPSVGGQIIPPAGYLQAVYARIRAAGGVCVADEVQTGLGRLGDFYFGFEQQEVIPDVVVLGKPMGNGHPLAAVITTRAIADSFANGPEFFSTFGGSTLSCRMGLEVLNIIDDESLMANAKARGDELLGGLNNLKTRHEAIGDIRGYGLFIGVDLICNSKARTPATKLAQFVKNRLRDHRILVGTEGPHDNILKIRPPLTIESNDIQMIISYLDKVLLESRALF